MYIGLHVKHLLFLPDFKKNQHVYRKFDENPKYQSSQTPGVTLRHAVGQMDRQTDREADKIKQTVAFTFCHLKRSTYGENLQLFKKYCYCIRQEGLVLWDILAM